MGGLGKFAAIALGLLATFGATGVLAGAGGLFSGGSEESSSARVVDTGGSVQSLSLPRDGFDDSGEANQEDDRDGDDELEVKGDLIDCPAGEDTRFKFEVEGAEFEVTGLLVSLDGGNVVVTGPEGDVTAVVAAVAEVKGAPRTGDLVKVEGSVLEDGSFLADEVEPACEDTDDEDADDHRGLDDDDHGDDDHSGPGGGGEDRSYEDGDDES